MNFLTLMDDYFFFRYNNEDKLITEIKNKKINDCHTHFK